MSHYRLRTVLMTGLLVTFAIIILGASPALRELTQQVSLLQAQVDALQSDSLIVIDGSGNELGALINNRSKREFEFYYDPLHVALIVSAESGRVGPEHENVFFDLPDCEGQPYLGQSMLNRLLVAGPNNAERFFIPADAPLVATIERPSNLGGTTCENTPGSGPLTDVMLLDEVTDSPLLTLQFEPPFRVIARGEL